MVSIVDFEEPTKFNFPPLPLVTDIEPPSGPEPAVREIDPPLMVELPVENTISPDAVLDSPVLRNTCPEGPSTAIPLRNIISPL